VFNLTIVKDTKEHRVQSGGKIERVNVCKLIVINDSTLNLTFSISNTQVESYSVFQTKDVVSVSKSVLRSERI
jgi:hypothetical protein